MLLDVDKLKAEVEYLRTNILVKNKLDSLYSTSDDEFLGISCQDVLKIYLKSEKLSLLLNWCKMICCRYDVKVYS